MKTKSYIAILFLSIFLLKFVGVDANGLKAFYNNSDVAFFYKPSCKKQNTPKQLREATHFSQTDVSFMQSVTLKGRCVSQFLIEVYCWELMETKTTIVCNVYLPAILGIPNLENASPPPRLT